MTKKVAPARMQSIKKWQDKHKQLYRIYQMRSVVRRYLRTASLDALMDLRFGVAQAIERKENK